MSLVLADVQPTDNPKITEITVLKEFEEMTNGDVLKALFPNMKVHEYTEKVVLQEIGQDFQVWGDAWYAWWNSPYKGVSE